MQISDIKCLLVSVILTYVSLSGTSGSIISRIVGGQLAGEGQFPYMALVRYNNNPNCGGAIISTTYVLTAGHCVHERAGSGPRFPASAMSVRVGSNRMSSGGVIVSVAEIKVHPEYRIQTSDVALLRLSGPIQLNNRIRPISISRANISPGTRAIVSGWGMLNTRTSMSEQLRFVTVTAVTDYVCFRQFPHRHASVFCFGHPAGQGICQGDSGSPLVLNGQSIGIVSFSPATCGSASPDGYSKVSNLAGWITQNSR